MKSFFLTCTGIAVCILGNTWQLCGQTATAATATVTFRNGQTVAVTNSSTSIGVQPRELVNVTVQFPPEAIGKPVMLEALDGGSTDIGGSIRVVEADGSLSFGFRAPAKPGQNSIRIRAGATTFSLQFAVPGLLSGS